MPQTPEDQLSRFATLTDGSGTTAVDPRQGPLPTVLFDLASTAHTASADSGSLDTSAVARLAVDVNVSALSGTSPTLNLYFDRLGADGNWYTVWSSAQITAVGTTSTSVGPGTSTAVVLTDTGRLRWVIGGTTPSITFSASIVGR